MTLQRPIKHSRCNIVLCGCVSVGARAIPVLFPACFRPPFYFFLILHPRSSRSEAGGLLAGRPASRCWFVKPEKAQPDSCKPLGSLATVSSWKGLCFISLFPSTLRLFVTPAWALRRGKTKTEWVDRRLWSICWTPAVVHTWQNRWLIRTNYALKAQKRDRSQIPRSSQAACDLMSGAITISAALITRARRSPFQIWEARHWLGAIPHSVANRFIICWVSNFLLVSHN